MAGQDSGQGRCDTTLDDTTLHEITDETDRTMVQHRGVSELRTATRVVVCC